jgi:RND family efflux transporter MFP subunit
LGIRLKLEGERLDIREKSVEAQLATQRAKIEQNKALYGLRRQELDDLSVRAGISGVLQQLEVEVGQLVTAGTVLARVSDPRRLKAALRVPETQVRDVQIGQHAEIDTRNGIIPGTVIRVDPASIEGTVTVDVQLDGDLPRGARPDLSVDGTIELERLDDVLYVGRPVYGQPESTISLFKVQPDGQYALRTQVELGKGSVNYFEIRGGLQEGDQVILSDMSAWDNYDRIKLNR